MKSCVAPTLASWAIGQSKNVDMDVDNSQELTIYAQVLASSSYSSNPSTTRSTGSLHGRVSTPSVTRTLTPLGGQQESGTCPRHSLPIPRLSSSWVYDSVDANQSFEISPVRPTSLRGSREPSSADDERQCRIATILRS